MAKPDLVGIIVRDMAKSLAFYRLLGVDIPLEADTEPHVEVTLPGGFRIAWDTQELIESVYGEWLEPHGHRMGLAFLCQPRRAWVPKPFGPGWRSAHGGPSQTPALQGQETQLLRYERRTARLRQPLDPP